MDYNSRPQPSVCFQVQKIIAVSLDGNTRNYQVQWAPTWVTWHHLVGCEDLIDEFIALQNSSQQKGEFLKQYSDKSPQVTETENVLAATDIQTEIGGSNGIESTQSVLVKDETLSVNDKENEIFHQNKSGEVSHSLLNDKENEIFHQNKSGEVSHSLSKIDKEIASSADLDNLNELENSDTGSTPFRKYTKMDKPNINCLLNVQHRETAEQDIDTERKYFERGDFIEVPYRNGLIKSSNDIFEIDKDSPTMVKKIDFYNNNNPYTDDNLIKYDFDTSPDEYCSQASGGNKCSLCGKVYSCKSSLQRHLRAHAGDKRYKCLVCGKRCLQSHDLKRHMRVHTGERPFRCKTCERTFSFKNGLKKHRCDCIAENEN